MVIMCARKSFGSQLLSISQAHLLQSQSCFSYLFHRNTHKNNMQLLPCYFYCSYVSDSPIDSFLNNVLKNNNLEKTIPLGCKQDTSGNAKSFKKKKSSNIKTLNSIKRDHLSSAYLPKKNYAIEKLLEKEGPEACLEHLRLQNDISKYSFHSASMKQLCHAASIAGSVDLVKKLLKLAEVNFAQTPRTFNEMCPYLALAEFNAGNYFACLEVLSNIFQIKNLASNKNNSQKLYLIQKSFFQKYYSKVLKDATASIITQIPEVGQMPHFDKLKSCHFLKEGQQHAVFISLADELVRLLEELLNLPWPAFALWQGYFFSTTQNELVRAEGLYKSKGVQKLALRNLRSVVEQLLTQHNVSQVQSFLELLLQYDQRSALPVITSLLLSMQCTEGNWRAAVEVLHFATSLKLRLSYNSLMRLQQLLHQHCVPLPSQLMHLKYMRAAQVEIKGPPEYKF